jgi:hypothetical protein
VHVERDIGIAERPDEIVTEEGPPGPSRPPGCEAEVAHRFERAGPERLVGSDEGDSFMGPGRIGQGAMVTRIETFGEVVGDPPEFAMPIDHRAVEDEAAIVRSPDPERQVEKVRTVGKPVDPARGALAPELIDDAGLERGTLEDEHEIGAMTAKGRGKTAREGAAQERSESPGPFFHGDDAASQPGERVPQCGTGPVISLVEFGDEEEADAGMDGRHARKVIRC